VLLRLNLGENTETLKNTEFEGKCFDKCKEFLWNAAHSPEQNALELVKVIFLQALEQTENLVVMLDGFDEVSQYYSRKVEMVIKEIMSKRRLKIWVASRYSDRMGLEEIMMKFAFTLRPFNDENQIACLEQYWNSKIESLDQKRLRNFAEELLRFSAKNFSDRDGQFNGIPLQIMMLGEAFEKEAESYCSNRKVNLPQNFNLLCLFKKFTDKKCDIYLSEKFGLDMSKSKGIRDKETCLDNNTNAALMSLFSPDEIKQLLDVKVATEFLRSEEPYEVGMISDLTDDIPRFIHRCFAEYFSARWFTKDIPESKEFISHNLFSSRFEVIGNIFNRILAEGFELHEAVLNNDLDAVNNLLKENNTHINNVHRGGRTALHLAASYNSTII
jgi:hypothetical protein